MTPPPLIPVYWRQDANNGNGVLDKKITGHHAARAPQRDKHYQHNDGMGAPEQAGRGLLYVVYT